uniref:Talin-2-like n=1 Tax=Dermatophagoides pteronyssinus TaxID=6956 RepID=A0A6P6YCT8_DERPT|nr:talin-2-like [Dermatophagoides pteronyssinus]
MSKLSLKIHFPGGPESPETTIKKIQLDSSMKVRKAIEEIYSKQNDRRVKMGKSSDYALYAFKEENGIKTGFWLDPERELQYYLLRDDACIEFRNKIRPLKIRLLDESIKTINVDSSQTVENLMPIICDKLGVANYEEYSLCRESLEPSMEMENISNNINGTMNGTMNGGSTGGGTLMRNTLRKNKQDQKMEQLKRKLKIDDDMNWIDHSKTLEEQDINPSTTLVFRRKYFYSDQNIDSRDPMQLHLLYVQTRDAIINGQHPVTLEQACEFAGIQCQIDHGDYVETKHKQGFLDLKNYLPKDYLKQKNIEKRIFMEHKKHIGRVNNLDAKVLYVTKARLLKTYGVTFFLVKEKMQGKNKLVPRLLGVTKDSVLRLDEKTKEILKTWPLTTVKRWAPTPNSFTLDFGDYSDSYYSVQTTEGEQISKLIGGYIDIILRRKKAKDHFGIDGDEGSAMIEDSVSPSKATIMQHQPDAKPSRPIIEDVAIPGIIRTGTGGPQLLKIDQIPEVKQIPIVQSQPTLTQSPVMAAQHPKYLQTGLSDPQRALLGTIGTGQDAVQKALNELDSKAIIPEYGPDLGYKQDQLDVKKATVSSQMAALNAATAQVLTLTSVPEEEVDHPALGAAISQITTNLPAMAKDVKMIAALSDDHDRGDRLIDAARNLCNAFSDLLRAAEPSNNVPRQNLITAANKVSDATSNLLYNIDDENMDREASDTLLSLSKPVANATAKLVLKAKDVASRCDDQASKNRVISAATQCALATSQLVSCAKVVAPTIHSPNCQKQIVDASKEVSKAVDNINRVCKDSIQDYHLNGQVDQAAGEVNDALNNLLNYVRSLGSTGHRGRKQPGDDGAVDTILDATDRLFSSTGDASEMVKQAKILAQATSQLIQNIKGQAETQPDSDIQKRLLSAAKSLADATSRLVEAAKGCATNPNDSNSQAALRAAAEDLRNATNTAASNALKQKLMNRLEATAKHATAMATQNIAAVHGCAPYNQNGPNQNEMNQLCREVNGSIPPVVSSIKAYHNEPNNSTKQSQLINSCENFMGPSLRLANVSLSSSPTISDKSASIQLTQSAQQLAEALSELRSCLTKASEACSFSNEINAAIDNIRQLNIELSECRMAALKHSLKPLPGDNFDHCSSRLNSACKSVASAMAQLLSATSQGEQNYIGTASREVTSSLKNLTSSARGVAATANERDVQMQVLDHSNQILELSVTLFEEIRWALENSQDSERHQRLTNIAKSLSSALQNCVTCLPSHKDLDDSIRQISDSTRSLTLDHHYSSHKSYAELQNDIQMAATRLNESTSEVIESSRLPSKLAPVSKNFALHYSTLFELTNEISGQTSDNLVKQQIRSCLDDLSASSSRFLQSAKTVSADPNAPNSSSQMAAAARSVTQSISNLLDICSSSAPGQKECDQAIQNIQMMRSYLDNPSIQLNDSTYFECLELVTEKSRRLGDAMTGIANNARRNEHESFGESVRDASDSVCGLLEGAAQAAYLVGASDPTSIAGRAGIIDINLLNRCQETIHNACAQLTAPAATKDQIIRCATDIAKSTSNLCNACRVASSRTQNPYHRKNFVQSAKDVANATATLIKEIKPLEESSAAHMNENCRIATRPLLESVDNLISFANSPEFASVPAQISGKARQHQQPITQYGKAIIDASSNMIMSAKTLAINPKDPPGWQILANHSKNVSDSIKKLVTSIKDASPGQNECDDALEKLGSCIKKLDQSSLDAINKILHVRNDNTAKGFREAVSASLSEIRENIDPVRVAGKSKAEKLGHSITQLIGYFDLLVSNSIGYASKIPDDKQQNQILDKSKAVCESALQLIYTVKECGGNPKATSLHSEIEDSSQDMKNAIKNFENLMQSAASEEGHVNSIIEQLTKSLTRITASSAIYSNGSGSSPDNLSYVDYQTRMVANVKDIARIAQDMSAKSSTQVSQLGSLCTRLSENYANLANDVNGIAAATNNIETASRIKSSVQELGTACVDIVKNAGSCLTNPGDSYSQRELTDSARNVSEKCSYVLAAFQAGSRGTQACIMAANSVQGIIGDIDTTILFANSGALNPEDPNDSFGIYKDEILKTAKALVEDTKTLVAGAASSQEALAVAAQNAVQTITQLTTAVKQGAATLGSNNSEAQVMLLNSVKDVAIALNELIDATKTASGKNINDPAMMHLKDSAKVMVTNVTSLLKTVKTVEDEQQRGTRALEATIDGIEGEIRSYDSGSMYINQDVTPEHLIRATKPVTMATAKAVAAGTSGQQDDIIVVANMGRKAIHDLLQVCKSAALLADNQEIKIRILDAGKKCSYDYQQLLKIIFHILQRPTNVNDVKQQLYQMSRTIAASVTEIVSLAEMLKNVDWVDPEDPTVIAENELLGAASSIDLAAKKLANLQPRIDSIKLPDEDLNFDEIILEAAKSIAQATAMLIRAASNAQKELVATGKVDAHGGGVHQFSDDDQWSEGLISASRHVAAATHSLVEAANALVLGQASEEKLISAAKQVASSTAQLLVACKVKADPESQAMKRLQTAGNAVKKATDNLVRAAQQAIEQEEEQNLIISKRRVQGITQEIVAREEILKKERELVEAREKLAAINRAKYGNRPPDEKDFGFTSVQQFNNTYYQQQDQQQQQTFNHNHPHHFHQEN